MTRKDFVLIAEVFATRRPHALDRPCYDFWYETVKDMAEALEKANPKFDVLKFIKACKNA